MQNTFFLPFPHFFIFIFILKRITKTTYHEMHKCNAMQILKKKKQRRMVTKSREMKHKDHVRKPQLD